MTECFGEVSENDYSTMKDEEVLYETKRKEMLFSITNYKEINKGFIKASFDLVIDEGLESEICIREYKLFKKGESEWISCPQREYEKDGKKSYFSYVKFGNAIFEKKTNEQIIKKLREKNNEQSKAYNKQTKNSFLGDSSDVWL